MLEIFAKSLDVQGGEEERTVEKRGERDMMRAVLGEAFGVWCLASWCVMTHLI